MEEDDGHQAQVYEFPAPKARGAVPSEPTGWRLRLIQLGMAALSIWVRLFTPRGAKVRLEVAIPGWVVGLECDT